MSPNLKLEESQNLDVFSTHKHIWKLICKFNFYVIVSERKTIPFKVLSIHLSLPQWKYS